MPEDRWTAYVAYHLERVRERILETERLMRPPTPEELLCLQQVLHRLQEQEATLASLLTAAPQGEVTLSRSQFFA